MAERVVSIRLVADASGVVRGFNAASDAAQEFKSKTLESMRTHRQEWATVGAGLTAVGVAITGLGIAVMKTGLEYNTLQQTSRAALTTLLGGAEAANAQMNKLDEFARNSPFAKQVFISAQQQMLAFGIETKKVIPYLDAVQNAVAAMGGSNQQISEIVTIMSKIQSSAKITATDLMQFGNHGVDAAALIGSQMNKTAGQIREDITAGSLDAGKALDALAAGMQDKFGGAAANVKNTFAGAMDRVKAAWRDFSAELAKPLVDPNGGGLLVDLLNWAADMMRAFQKLPEPVKVTTTAIVGLVGATALLGGAAILALPKWFAFTSALSTLLTTMPAIRGALSGITSFLTGPWGIALAAAGLALYAFNQAIEYGTYTQAEMVNALKTSRDANEALKESFGEQNAVSTWWYGDLKEELQDLPAILDKAQGAGEGFWRWFSTTPTDKTILDRVSEAGEALAEMAATDLPLAQRKFKEFAESFNLNEEQIQQALREMPAFRDEIVRQVDSMGLAADEATVMAYAMGEIGPAAEEAAKWSGESAETFMEQAKAAKEAQDQLFKLLDALNQSNSAAQGAEAANARYQQTLADVSEYIANAQAGVEGYSLSLDANTVEGSKNREMLAGMAADSQNAAKKLYEQELATLGVDQATSNYTARLAEGREGLIQTLMQFGYTREAAELYADEIYRIPTEAETKFIADTAQATRDVHAWLASIPSVVRIGVGTYWASASDEARMLTRANGGTVGFARGGTIPGAASGWTVGAGGGVAAGTVYGQGTSKSDSIMVRLSKGEEVIQEPYASMNRGLLKAINRGELHQGSLRPQVIVAPNSGSTQVSLAGARFVMEIDGRAVTAVVQEQIAGALAPVSAGNVMSELGVR